MAKGHKGLPKAQSVALSKTQLLNDLHVVDGDRVITARILSMETAFRQRVGTHIEGLPASDASFNKFNTNPFVLLIHSRHKGYQRVSQIEQDILPAKMFSSMETSAGKMVELVVLPAYGWEPVFSEMHTPYSSIDGRSLKDNVLCLATLKSGPRCLNDEMSENLADAVLNNFEAWAADAGVQEIDFTYGVLYGTPKQSNKKDWHILRKIAEKLTDEELLESPNHRWSCRFRKHGITVTVTVRIGIDLWNYIGGTRTAFAEMTSALIRACITPTNIAAVPYQYTIADLENIVSIATVPEHFNVSLLQRSQIEWLFFFACHFCDVLESGLF